MDSRSSLSMLESEDATMISLATEIDIHTSHLRNSVLQSIAAIRSKIHAQTAEAMDHQLQLAQSTEQKLLSQLEMVQDILETRTAELARERQLNEKLVTLQFTQHRRNRIRAAAAASLRAWHQYVQRQKFLERTCAQLTAQRQERDARNVFHAWRLQAQRAKFDEATLKMQSDHRRATAKLTHEFQASENTNKLEIIALKEKLAQEEERRGVLEEKLKAAFMRGVCALNLEAMQVLKNTSDVNAADISVASLLQNMNVTLGGGGGVNGSMQHQSQSMDGMAERLLQRQSELQDQLSALQPAVSTNFLATGSARAQQSSVATQPPPPSAVAASRAQHHQAFTVTVNPHRRPQSASSGAPATTSASGHKSSTSTIARSSLRR